VPGGIVQILAPLFAAWRVAFVPTGKRLRSPDLKKGLGRIPLNARPVIWKTLVFLAMMIGGVGQLFRIDETGL
jgi:hypothetical protein